VPELGGFEVDPNRTEGERIEAIKMVMKAWEREEFTWKNAYDIPPVQVVPKPVQLPHPPLWMANNGPQGHLACGRAGAGLLSFNVLTPLEALAELPGSRRNHAPEPRASQRRRSRTRDALLRSDGGARHPGIRQRHAVGE
jgi:alkanesulfonate monooxygenase SsuD/methylene tetrahydromethanopterin reductase-like flavin-dependent oxidoreductase (luciferase family)